MSDIFNWIQDNLNWPLNLKVEYKHECTFNPTRSWIREPVLCDSLHENDLCMIVTSGEKKSDKSQQGIMRPPDESNLEPSRTGMLPLSHPGGQNTRDEQPTYPSTHTWDEVQVWSFM